MVVKGSVFDKLCVAAMAEDPVGRARNLAAFAACGAVAELLVALLRPGLADAPVFISCTSAWRRPPPCRPDASPPHRTPVRRRRLAQRSSTGWAMRRRSPPPGKGKRAGPGFGPFCVGRRSWMRCASRRHPQ